MKKVIKLKESKVLEIIDNLINEQGTAAQPIVVNASNSLGTYPSFDGLKNLLKTLKANVEKALRGSTPYRIKNNLPEGVAKARKEGSALRLDVTLEPCEEKDRDWYFDCSVAIYSEVNTSAVDILRAKVMEKAASRGQGFIGSEKKIEVLGRNTIGLSAFKDLNPNSPEKSYKLYLIYIAGGRPEGYQEVGDDGEINPKEYEPQPAAENPWNQKKTNEPVSPAPVNTQAEKKTLNEVVSSGYTATNCDELHAFQGTGGKVVGNMNVVVGNKLEELYKAGHNPRVTDVKVSVDGMNVNWSCTIIESPDGKAWVGFTSRGAGCGNDVKNRAESASVGNDMASAKKKIMSTYGEENIDIEKASEVNYNAGNNSFRQIFYVYTKPGKFPANK